MTTELTDAMNLAEATPWGPACTTRWIRALEIARAQQDEEAELHCHLELIRAHVFEGTSSQIIAPFLWVHQRWQAGALSPEQEQQLAWNYRHVIRAMIEVPAVPLEQIKAMLAGMESHYRQRGASLRPVHRLRYRLAEQLGHPDEAEAQFQLWYAAAPGGDLGDCPACDPLMEISRLAARGDWEAAYQAGMAGLDGDGGSCAAQPEKSLAQLLEPMLRTGRDAEAWAAHVRAYRRHQSDPSWFGDLAAHVSYLSLSGTAGRPERLDRGARLLIRHAEWWARAGTPAQLFAVAVPALNLLRALPEAPETVLPMTVPGADIAWAPQPSLHHPTIGETQEWLLSLAQEFAAGFDARSGRPVLATALATRLSPEPVTPLPRQVIPDVTGMSEPDPTDYRITTGEPTASAPAAPPAGGGADKPQDPPLPAVPLDGRWREMSAHELLAHAHDMGTRLPSLYLLEVLERIFAGAAAPTDLDDDGAELWRRAEGLVDQTLEKGDGPLPPGTSADPAYRLLETANQLLDDGQEAASAEHAFQAMRTQTADPLGVRLHGLQALGTAALLAGYCEEAIDSLRQAVNMMAACGFRLQQAELSAGLALALSCADRDLEAAEVAETGLLLVADHPRAELTQSLRTMAARALTSLGHDDQAGQRYVEIARAADTDESAAHAWVDAADSFCRAGDIREEIAAVRQAVIVAERLFDGSDIDAGRYLSTILRRAANAIAAQHEVCDADVAEWERLMARNRELQAVPGLCPVSADWAQGQWFYDVASLYYRSDRSMLAIDHLRAACDAFARAQAITKHAESLRWLAVIHAQRGEIDSAVDAAQQGLALLDTALHRNGDEAQRLRQLLADLHD